MIYKNQSGRTMLEMLGVLGIMGIITYGAISSINYGMVSYKVNQLYIDISDIINGIQDMYLTVFGRKSFTPLNCNTTLSGVSKDCETLIKNGILSKNIRELIINVENNELSVTLKTPNQELCNRLQQMDWKIQSITCKNEGGTDCLEIGANCCSSSPYTIKFTPN